MSTLFINTDGGSRGNPGPAAIGVVFFDENGKIVHDFKKFIGNGTNNDAEYQAIINALSLLTKSRWFLECNGRGHELICRLDSQLVVEQVNGNYKVKQPHIKSYIDQIYSIIKDFKLSVHFVHIPREENKEADKLVNEALDAELKGK